MKVFTSIKKHSDTIIKFLPLLAFVIPLALLYGLNLSDPYLKVSTQNSFQLMWKGRTFQLFFIWLIALQFILSWDTIQLKINKHSRAELVAFAVAFLLPTVYVVSEYYFGLNAAIANFSFQSGVSFWYSMPLAVEYLAFSGFFFVVIFFSLGKKGLTGFALPGLFAALVGIIYTIDNVFPYGQFTPFQLLVPTTATLAAKVLGLMGYSTSMTSQSGMPVLQATGPLGTATFSIAWPCAGIESLLIFTAVCSTVSPADASVMEVESWVFCLWRSHHILHKHHSNSQYIHYWSTVWSKFFPSADVPLLLWPAVRDCMDCFLSAGYFGEPSFLAKNKKRKSPRL